MSFSLSLKEPLFGNEILSINKGKDKQQAQQGNTTIINNYYGDQGPQGPQHRPPHHCQHQQQPQQQEMMQMFMQMFAAMMQICGQQQQGNNGANAFAQAGNGFASASASAGTNPMALLA